ncbi:uncharacterized protein LOC106181151 [Lingula anatina]|uniref:Uncharacterized protein LOC106181151 n=1 Tax=Lingula anatina TaxID=7574 RepID=A0A1S3KF90_LINAN|nr:uncharacterized protein LOC106181151 [Lingula anatina]|eukprot:XP_013420906.1 uncharacterized protein LOC106181151 [Lingula anatina]
MELCQVVLIVLAHLTTSAYQIKGNSTHIYSDAPYPVKRPRTQLYMTVFPFSKAISIRWDLTSYDYITDITAKYNVTPGSPITISNITRFTKEVNITHLPANRPVTVCLHVTFSNEKPVQKCSTKTTLRKIQPIPPVNNVQELSIEATITLSVLIILIVAIAVICIIFARYQKKQALKRQQARALRVRARIQGRVSQDPKKAAIGKILEHKHLPLDSKTLTEDWSVSSEVKVQDWQQNRISLDFEPPSDAPVVDTEDLVFFQNHTNGKIKHDDGKSSSLNSQSKVGSKASDEKPSTEEKSSLKEAHESPSATLSPEAAVAEDITPRSSEENVPAETTKTTEEKKTSRKTTSGPPRRKTLEEKLRYARKINAKANRMNSKSGTDRRSGNKTSSGKRRSSRTSGERSRSRSSHKQDGESGERPSSHSTSQSKSQPAESHNPVSTD